MKRREKITPAIVALSVAAMFSTGFARAQAPAGVDEATEPAPINKLIYAQPFRLQDGFEYTSRKERPHVTSGYLLVIDAAPELAREMAIGSPILYVGRQTTRRLNPYTPSGRVFVIVPAELDKNGEVDLDLKEIRMWFGTAGLVGNVDQKKIDEEHLLAVRSGIGRRPWKEIDVALAEAEGQPQEFRDFLDLRRHATGLMKQYLPPEEAKHADVWLRMERVREDPVAGE